MKRINKVRLLKYARLSGLVVAGAILGFSAAHLNLVRPQSAAADSSRSEIRRAHQEKVAKAHTAKSKKIHRAHHAKKLAKAKHGHKQKKLAKKKPAKAKKIAKAKGHGKKKRA